MYITAYENVSPNEPIERTKDWVKSAPVKKVLSLANGWEPDLVRVLSAPAIRDESGNQATRWAVHTVPDLPSFVFGPVAIIGDAAHAMLPHQGLGACQGVEDAYVLSQLLQHPLTKIATLKKALQAFDRVRRPLAQEVAMKSEVVGKMFDYEYEPHFGKPLWEIALDMGNVSNWLSDEDGCEVSAWTAIKEFEGLCGGSPPAAYSDTRYFRGFTGDGTDGVTTVNLRDIEGPNIRDV